MVTMKTAYPSNQYHNDGINNSSNEMHYSQSSATMNNSMLVNTQYSPGTAASMTAPSLICYQPTITLSLGGVQFSLHPSPVNNNTNGPSFAVQQNQMDMIINLSNFTGHLRVSMVPGGGGAAVPQVCNTAAQAGNWSPMVFNTNNNYGWHPSQKQVTPHQQLKKGDPGFVQRRQSKPKKDKEDKVPKLTSKRSRENVIVSTEVRKSTEPLVKNFLPSKESQSQSLLVENESEETKIVLTQQQPFSQTQTQFSTPHTNTVDDDEEYEDEYKMDGGAMLYKLHEKNPNETYKRNLATEEDTTRPAKTPKRTNEQKQDVGLFDQDYVPLEFSCDRTTKTERSTTPVDELRRFLVESASDSDSVERNIGVKNDSIVLKVKKHPSLSSHHSSSSSTSSSNSDNNVNSYKTNGKCTIDEEDKNTSNRQSVNMIEESSPVTATPPKGHAPPCQRWGHTLTHVGNDRIVMYGGQTLDEGSKAPRTLGDLFLYDTKKHVWFRPFNCDGMDRQWHTCTFLPDRNLLISFGGETTVVTKHKTTGRETKSLKATDKVMVLDTEIMLWYPPAITGVEPGGRSGHTATLLPKTNEIVVFGGVLQGGSRWSNSVSILDTNRWVWSIPKITGTAPKPRSYHSAVAITGTNNTSNRIVYFGGNDARQSFFTVHVLDAVVTSTASTTQCADGTNRPTVHNTTTEWIWKHPTVSGDVPNPRTGHTATLLPDHKTILVYGGWDPSMEDEETQQVCYNDENIINGDTYLLDTDTWIWTKGPGVYYAVFPSHDLLSYGDDGGPKRVGHSAVLLSQPNNHHHVDVDTMNHDNNNNNNNDSNDNLLLLSNGENNESTNNNTGDNIPSNRDDNTNNNEQKIVSTTNLGSEILIFGGRIPGDKFTGDFQIITI